MYNNYTKFADSFRYWYLCKTCDKWLTHNSIIITASLRNKFHIFNEWHLETKTVCSIFVKKKQFKFEENPEDECDEWCVYHYVYFEINFFFFNYTYTYVLLPLLQIQELDLSLPPFFEIGPNKTRHSKA